MNKIITISREFGSGGRELGKRLSDKLECAYYDHEIVREIAKRTDISEEYIQHAGHQRPIYALPIHIGMSFMFLENPIWSSNQTIFKEQCNVLREAAERSDCVIVGRCADYILKEFNPFRIFVYSDMESKLKRCREKSEHFAELSDRELQKKIKEIDRRRSQYYEFFTNQKWGERENYDMCVNTSARGVKELAEAIAKLSR